MILVCNNVMVKPYPNPSVELAFLPFPNLNPQP